MPVTNARYALNAANARWGSLYDALYGTDAIPETDGRQRGQRLQPDARRGGGRLGPGLPRRGGAARRTATGRRSRGFAVDERGARGRARATARRRSRGPGSSPATSASAAAPRQFLLRNNGLHIEVADRRHAPRSARDDPAGISDVWLEAAITTIMDCEDSVAAVDAEDKVAVYRNWLGLMKGDLTAPVEKGGRSFTRRLNPDLDYFAPDGGTVDRPAAGADAGAQRRPPDDHPGDPRRDGAEVPEGIIDAMVTALVALHDVGPAGRRANSPAGSVYVVKPKMHGPEEVAFAVELFGRVEAVLGMAPNTLKIGIMDEERRTTVNLKACIRAARERVVFINTGFLDRTGDEIHTSMEAGAGDPARAR